MFVQEIIDLNRNGTGVIKKSTDFCCMSVTASSLPLGALLRDNLQMGAFLA